MVAALAALITALTLPLGAIYDSVQPVAGKLLVSGSVGSGCVWVIVDPKVLAGRSLRGSCSRPPLAAHRAVPVVIPNPRSQWQAVRIALTGKTVTYGRVVMRYRDGSDTRPVSAYGHGSLWLYDVDTDRGSELLRFSSLSGKLEQAVAMPQLYRPVIAADEDGLYLMAAVNGGAGRDPQALYYVSPNAKRPEVVHREGRAALWIVAHAHSVWTEIVSGTSSTSLWRFDGPNAQAKLLWRRHIETPAPAATYGDGSIWTVAPVWAARDSAQCSKETISRIDPATGRERVLATVPASGDCSLLLDPQGLTFSNGALFFLSGSRLYRVAR